MKATKSDHHSADFRNLALKYWTETKHQGFEILTILSILVRENLEGAGCFPSLITLAAKLRFEVWGIRFESGA